jgi:hypothetical protein
MKYRVIKILRAPDDYSRKTRKNILNSFSHHDNANTEHGLREHSSACQ